MADAFSTVQAESLAHFIDWATNNIYEVRRHNQEWYRQFARIDEAYSIAFNNLSDSGSVHFGLLLARSRSAFRGSCMIAMSGQSVEAYMLMRGCLEAALYALHINSNPKLWQVWLNRHDSEEARETCKDAFGYRKVERTLKVKSKVLCTALSQLYEMTIDLGGHPNKRSITDGLRIDKDTHNKTITMQYLVGDPYQLTEAFKAISAVGICALYILQLARPEYFKQLGIDAIIDQVSDGISQSDPQ